MIGETPENEGPRPLLPRMAEDLERRYEAQSVSLRIHGFVFAACSAGIIFLNTISTPYPWAFFPIAGWAIGLGCHAQAFLNRRRERAQAGRAANASDQAARLLRNYQLGEGAWKQHRAAFVLANGFLWGVNAITTMAFPWAAIVTGAWAIGLASHWIARSSKRRRQRGELAKEGVDGSVLGSRGPSAGAALPLTAEARSIAMRMEAANRGGKEAKARWSELGPLLGTAIAQIEELELKSAQFDRLVSAIPDIRGASGLEELRRKRDAAATEALRAEYDRSIAQRESQLKSMADLRQHREILGLRLSGALDLVRQLELDGARVASLEGYGEPAGLSLLRRKTEETQRFLEDARAGMDSLDWR
jgi:hypothetical protein